MPIISRAALERMNPSVRSKIVRLYDNGKGLSQSDLARRFSVSPTAILGVLRAAGVKEKRPEGKGRPSKEEIVDEQKKYEEKINDAFIKRRFLSKSNKNPE